MASLLCVQQPGGAINVRLDDQHSQLVRDSESKIVTTYVPMTSTREKYARRPQSTPNPVIRNDNIEPKNLVSQALKLQAWVNSSSIKHVEERSNAEARVVRTVCNDFLDNQETFVKSLDKYCKYEDFLNMRKRELLHKKWSERVAEPIRTAVIAKVDSAAYDELRKRKHELYREYLEHVNKKGHVYLDSYDPEEYYPLALSAARPPVVQGLSAKHQTLNDPTLLQGQRRYSEERTELACTVGTYYSNKGLDSLKLPPMPLGRHTVNSVVWTSLPLTDIESDPRKMSRRRMAQLPYSSVINFKEWSTVPVTDPDIFEKEMRVQKKRHCQQPPFSKHSSMLSRKRVMEGYLDDVMNSKTLPLEHHGHHDPGYDSSGSLESITAGAINFVTEQRQNRGGLAASEGLPRMVNEPFQDTSTYQDSYMDMPVDISIVPENSRPIV